MSKKQRYLHIKHFSNKLELLKKQKLDFELTSTSYTKKITTEKEVMFFNPEGEDDKKVLLLISSVRSDAKKFLAKKTKEDSLEEVRSLETDFFNLLDIIKSDEIIVKVDIKQAYWEYALKVGIITKATNDKFLTWYENIDAYYAKQARLKALGSLATSKFTSIYQGGKLTYNKPPSTEKTRDIYMEVCNGIDRLMKDCNFNVDGCKYYYWDCIFVSKEFEQDAIDYINSRGYDVSTEETKLEYVTIGDIGYLLSTSDNKIYMTKKENKFLLDWEDDN
jgi:hypothetical protein